MSEQTLVVAYDVTGLSKDEVIGLVGEAWAQGEASERHPDVRVLSTTVPFTVVDETELTGILHVGAGL